MQKTIEIPKPLKPFLKQKKRFKVAFGGRGGGKSIMFANAMINCAYNGAMVGCFREYQTSIDDSVHSLLSARISDIGAPGFIMQKNLIDHKSGGGFRFKGLARSIEAVKSMHGFNFFWLEEGQFISNDSLKILTPTLREQDSELWISANAMNSADPFAQRFIVPYQKELDKTGIYQDDLHLIVKINYSDNPWFPDTLEQERLYDLEHLPRALYDHIWEGAFNDSVDDSIIMAEWFDAAVDADKKLGFKPAGAIICAHDPSDEGGDEKGLVIRHGSVILDCEQRDFGDVCDGCDWAIDRTIHADTDLFVWDADGLGLTLKRQIAKAFNGKKIDFRMFHGAGQVDQPSDIYESMDGAIISTQKEKTNENTFKNRRAQRYWQLRDRFFNTWLAVEKGQYIDPDKLISIRSDCKDIMALRSEVCRIPRKYNAQGTIQIMSKIEMKRLKIKSPNLADSLMMAMESPAPAYDDTPLIFETVY